MENFFFCAMKIEPSAPFLLRNETYNSAEKLRKRRRQSLLLLRNFAWFL